MSADPIARALVDAIADELVDRIADAVAERLSSRSLAQQQQTPNGKPSGTPTEIGRHIGISRVAVEAACASGALTAVRRKKRGGHNGYDIEWNDADAWRRRGCPT